MAVASLTMDADFVSARSYEEHHEKTGFLPMRKQRRRSAVQ